MGKVYDALRRAEEQRTQRIQETTDSAAGIPAPVPASVVAPGAVPAANTGARAPARARKEGSLLASLRGRSSGAALASASDLNKRRIALLQPESVVAEQFRTLRGRIDSLAATRPICTIAVTSANRGDGKTLAAISLSAVTAMQPGRRVLLIDCDMRDPGVSTSLGLRVEAGLAEVLSGTASIDDAICKADGADLDVLAVRSVPQNPSELLASTAMVDLLAKVSEVYDRVVVDLPPTLGLPDAKGMSELCDGVVFMVRADQTPAGDVETAIEILGRDRIIGLVMNGESAESAPYARD